MGSEGGGANLWPKIWPRALAPKRWPPQRLVGPDGGASPKQSIKGFGREVGKGSGRGRGSGRGVRAREEVRGSGRAKGLEGERWGGSQEAPPPYTLCSPPPSDQSSCGGAPRALGSGQRWGAPLAPSSFPRFAREGCASKKKGPGRTRPRA